MGTTHTVRPFRIGGECILFMFYKRCSQLYRRYIDQRRDEDLRGARIRA